jgi:putative oxidoreductase
VFKRLLLLRQVPLMPDLGRLVLRLMIFLPLFLKHGREELFSFGPTLQHFQDPQRVLDPLHIGVFPTLVIATVADGICSLLIILGFATRWAALFAFGNLLVVWTFVDHFITIRKGLNPGEPVLLYVGGCLAVFFLGAGKFSLDALIEGAGGKKRVLPSWFYFVLWRG